MNVYNALWDDPEQKLRPPDDDFQLFTMEEWMSMSSTHKILTGSFRCPLPPGIELPDNPTGRQSQSAKEQQEQNKNLVDKQPQNKPGPSRPKSTQQSVNSHTKEAIPYIPGLVKLPILNRSSSISADEQRECLRLLMKFDGKSLENLTAVEKAEYQLFCALYTRVKQEQKEFLECAKLSWPEYAIRATRCRGDPYNYFIQHWKNRVTQTISQYPTRYKKIKVLSLRPKEDVFMKMHHISNVLNIGKVPIVKLPEFKCPFRISTSLIRLRAWGLMNVPASQLNGTLHGVPVSRDPNAARLARLHGANIVISTSAFKCLVDNYDEKKHQHPNGLGRSWMIPITIKEHRSFCDGKPVTKTVVFVDKVLPTPKTTGYDKVCWYQKHALFAATVHRYNPGGIEFEVKGTDIMIRNNVPDESFKNSNPQSEEINEVSNVPQPEKGSDIADNQKPTDSSNSDSKSELSSVPKVVHHTSVGAATPKTNDSDQDDDSSSDECGLKIALSDEETEDRPASCSLAPMKPSETITNVSKNVKHRNKLIKNGQNKTEILEENKTLKEQCLNSSPAMDNHSADKWKNIPPPAPVNTVNGNALPVSTNNVTYNMWSFQSVKKGSQEKSEHPNVVGNINVLIRSHYDGCESLQSGNYQPLCLSSKPEFQLEYGAGVTPLSDLSKQWAKLLIQPDCLLARVRVNVFSTEMIKVEKRTQADLEKEAQALHQTDLRESLNTLFDVLADLCQLPCGEYLLSHQPDMGQTAELFIKANVGDVADKSLLSEYGSLPSEIPCEVPWQPLDPNAIVPKHMFREVMPCTFPSPSMRATCPKKFKEPRFVANIDPKKNNKKKKSKRKNRERNDSSQANESTKE
ncbi:hypothetical protein ONE63_007496 [Megalurothrips usitatus]|uniref:Little elongation complex subunit 2 C-terminal domain-containing protein n=1 Tax=Megalurothrips usitatus TaxID=439358 RepID=A0AAV7XS42_9NEOP|nr:hypothetical protein ONE63_007496 [Megalurothrips usitatus]